MAKVEDLALEMLILEDENFSTDEELIDVDIEQCPPEFKGYRRTSRDLAVTATSKKDNIIQGMGIAWICERPDKNQVLWIKAAEVNNAYRRKGLERILISALTQQANSDGFSGVRLDARLNKYVKPKKWWEFWK